MSTAEEEKIPKEEPPETAAEREMAALRESGVLRKELPTITRSTFDQVSPQEQMDFVRAGGRLIDDPAPAKVPLPEGAIRRSTFDRMTPAAQMEYTRNGGKLIDDQLVAD